MTEEDVVHRLRNEPAYREGFLSGIKKAYDQHLNTVPNPTPFLEWVLAVHGPAIWNELYSVHHSSSYVVSLDGLTRADGQRVTRGY